jgi:hypothetical protein
MKSGDVHAARLIGETRDPIKDWFLVVRAASPRLHERFEGDARLAQLVYDAADVLRRLLFDLTGEVEPDVDEVLGWPRDWKRADARPRAAPCLRP